MDGLTGPIPFHIAKAYGVKAAVDPSRVGKPVTTAGQVDAGVVRPAFPQDQFATRLDSMVGGTVESPIGRGEGFDAPAAATTRAPGSDRFQMYTRAADSIEVSTKISLGRQIDTLA
ncbi:MAG: hypothetical protein EXS10_02615 [Phycisphaerales bacterium]|nr:hypothetical protein [Phycisphaerales bacterium]